MELSKKDVQDFGKDPVELRESEHYQLEYIENFVDKWDELINWEAREKTEGDFFIRELEKRNLKKILDVATGTGFHSVRLLRAGFDVVSADGSPEMLAKAFANGRDYGYILRTIQADWRWLNQDINGRFDSVICLANSLTHLFSEHDRRKALAEFYSALRHDGVLIIDHRNYDSILDNGYSSKHSYYYCGKDVKAEPEHIDPGLARFRYEFPDNSVYHLNMYPLRKDYMVRLLKEVGFQTVKTYADFQETDMVDDPDFYIHVAEKKYKKSFIVDGAIKESKTPEFSEAVETTKSYYDSEAADRFYFNVWGGEDIHIGLYQDDEESIFDASRRTVEHMASLIPQEITDQTRILDLGAGYGGSARYLARTYGCKVVALNLSELQNQRNRKMNRKANLGHLIDVVDGNFENVPYSENSFDVIWSQDSFLHSGDREKVVIEASRLLKSGGTFIFTDPMQVKDVPKKELKPVLDRIHLETMGSIDFYSNMATKYGFEEVAIEDHTYQLINHYGRVKKELEGRYDEIIKICGADYVDRMIEGLTHWVDKGEKNYLKWGMLVFTKK
ncbi:MAG: methyltransferase domain-containing protein [Balneolales bacterium]